jgi:hypothetical protein
VGKGGYRTADMAEADPPYNHRRARDGLGRVGVAKTMDAENDGRLAAFAHAATLSGASRIRIFTDRPAMSDSSLELLHKKL